VRLVVPLVFAMACGHRFDPQVAAQLDASAVAVGATAPDATVTRASGNTTTLAAAFAARPQTIVVFYRGFF
jgi:hypothetical protein